MDSKAEFSQVIHQRSEGRRYRLACTAYFGSDHDIAWSHLRGQAAAEPRDDPWTGGKPSGGGPARAESGVDRTEPAHRGLFDPQRRADYRPGHEPPRTYRPSADSGNTTRYR